MKEKRTEEIKEGKKISKIIQIFKMEDGNTIKRESTEYTKI